MAQGIRGHQPDPIPFQSLTAFFLIAFGLAWGILGLYIVFPEQMGAVFGPLSGSHPLFFLAVYSPAIAAFTLVFRYGGLAGVQRFLKRALRWRCSPAWYAFLILGIPLIFIVGSALNGNLLAQPFPFASFDALLLGLALAAIKGPVEEFGWRGLALPLLQRRFAPLWAALMLGAVWGMWHFPAFLLSGTQQSDWSFSVFFAGCLAISVIATALFNNSQGSILLAAFFHFSLMNPVFPDAQPYDTYLLIVVAALIVWRKRDEMLKQEGAVTTVIPSRGSADNGRRQPRGRRSVASPGSS
jgi:hypothetical protein